jgi:acyl-homoserine-lactone acylase
MPTPRRASFMALLCVLAAGCAHTPPTPPPLPPLAQQVEIRRTAHGVPHILAENLRAAAFALAWVQLEDHGTVIIRGIESARGRLALVEGEDRIDADALARQRHARAVEMFEHLAADTRDVYVGFAEGMNHYIRVHRAGLPDWMQPDFSGPDVLAREIGWPNVGAMNAFRRRLLDEPGDAALLALDAGGSWRRVGERAATPGPGAAARDADQAAPAAAAAGAAPYQDTDNVGSNAWAIAPDRTASGRAILLRNPHLAWTAGYYEAHVRVPGRLDFYGDFRIGGPFTVIGGFNQDLGFATTNNATRSHEFYAFRLDPARADHYLLDGVAHPLQRREVSVEYRAASGHATAERHFWHTHLGPVVHRNDSLVYILRAAGDGEYRAGEQWLEMMRARSLDEWRDAMRIEARTTSNFTYADRAGNIFYVWVSGAPLLPHPAGGDSLAILAIRSEHVWTRRAAFDSLPQLLNPTGGYVRNENDSPHFTNMFEVLPDSFPFWVEPPNLRLRSQHGVALLHNDRVFSLEDVVETKHSMRMLLADRVKDDLIRAARQHGGEPELPRAAAVLEGWDNSVAAESRGGVLFEAWWTRYRAQLRDRQPFAVAWSSADPLATPRGLADPAAAVQALADAAREIERRHGRIDVPWGDVHRVRRGDVDAPVGGCGGALGCFRVLNFATDTDGRRVVNGGDGWVIAVEFGDVPRAYSVLAYGQSPDPESPYHATQARLFAENRMKAVYWTEADIARAAVLRYRPGEARASR